MLMRPRHALCVEYGTPYGTPNFEYHSGRIEGGPAYWSDRGLLCSVACSVEHLRRRRAAGETVGLPAPNPLDLMSAGGADGLAPGWTVAGREDASP